MVNFFNKNKKWKKCYLSLLDAKERLGLEAYNLKEIEALNFKQVKFPECCSKIPGMDVVGYISKGVLYVHKFNCEKIDLAKKRYVMDWNMQKLEEFPKTYYFTLIINYNPSLLKINQLIHLITSKGHEITYLQTTKINTHSKSTTFKLKVSYYHEIRKLIDDIKFKFDSVEIIEK